MSRMRFGIFMAPFHPAGISPTVLLDGDLELICHLDKLGFEEAWIGEHHSAGSEIIASPEIFIAAAAQRTRRIKHGSGAIDNLKAVEQSTAKYRAELDAKAKSPTS